MEKKKEKNEKDSCPCGAFGKCCETPEVGSGDHECDDKCELVCENNYQLVCRNCGSSCYHEL